MTDITKDFPAGRVLHGVDLRVRAGTVHALVGENGAGKSTLINVLGGVFSNYGGAVQIDGVPHEMTTPRASLAAGVAIIHQEFALVPDFTVADNIALGRELRGRVSGTVNRRATLHRSVVEANRLGIELDLARTVSSLPVDQRQLVEIVKAIARDARILVMDEPTARLTASERTQLFNIIARLKSEGVGIVYISHFLEEIFGIAESVTVLRDGRSVAELTISETSTSDLARLMVGDRATVQPLARLGWEPTTVADRHDGTVALEVRSVASAGRLDAANLTVGRGEIIALAGLSNSGNGELARAIAGASVRATGCVVVGGREIGIPRSPRQAARAGVAYVTADRKSSGILGSRPVSDNIVLGALPTKLSTLGVIRRQARRELVEELIERFGIKVSSPSQAMALLSGGNQQKALLARAIATDPLVLVLDQPTVGVDVAAKEELYGHIEQLAQSGVAVVLVSDDLDEVLRLAHTVHVVRGRRVLEGCPANEFDRASLLEAITCEVGPPTPRTGSSHRSTRTNRDAARTQQANRPSGAETPAGSSNPRKETAR